MSFLSENLIDRILLIHTIGAPEWAKYHQNLIRKGYKVELVEQEKLALAPTIPLDLVVLCLDENVAYREIIEELKKQILAPTTPCIVLVTEDVGEIDLSGSPNVHVLEYSDEISKFLVTVSIQLRLRKIRNEHTESQVEIVSQNASLRDLNNRFEQDLKEAREIHEKLLPNSLPYFSKIKCATSYLPLELVGGDLFDVWKIADNSVGIFLGDITGHGLPAAFIASMTKMCFNLSPDKETSEGLNFINQSLHGFLPEGRFITAINCLINAENKTLQFANAGHPPPLHYSKSRQTVDLLIERGMPINIDPEIKYKARTIPIESGDKFLFYSDGLYETLNMNNEIMGIPTLKDKFLDFCLSEEIETAVKSIVDYQEEYSKGRKYRDDVTIIGIEIV